MCAAKGCRDIASRPRPQCRDRRESRRPRSNDSEYPVRSAAPSEQLPYEFRIQKKVAMEAGPVEVGLEHDCRVLGFSAVQMIFKVLA